MSPATIGIPVMSLAYSVLDDSTTRHSSGLKVVALVLAFSLAWLGCARIALNGKLLAGCNGSSAHLVFGYVTLRTL